MTLGANACLGFLLDSCFGILNIEVNIEDMFCVNRYAILNNTYVKDYLNINADLWDN